MYVPLKIDCPWLGIFVDFSSLKALCLGDQNWTPEWDFLPTMQALNKYVPWLIFSAFEASWALQFSSIILFPWF